MITKLNFYLAVPLFLIIFTKPLINPLKPKHKITNYSHKGNHKYWLTVLSKTIKLQKWVIKTIVLRSYIERFDPILSLAITRVESEGKAGAVSSAGAIGLMQVMPYHVKGSPKKLFNPWLNIRIGIHYLKNVCFRRYGHNNIVRAISSYNTGPNSRWINMRYVRNVVKNYRKIAKLEGFYDAMMFFVDEFPSEWLDYKKHILSIRINR